MRALFLNVSWQSVAFAAESYLKSAIIIERDANANCLLIKTNN